VYPVDLDSHGELPLRWEEGFLAELLLRCAGAGDHLQAVNVKKLRSHIADRSEGNPWRLDGRTLSSALACGRLSLRNLKLLPSGDVELEAAPGRWISGNPMIEVPVESDGRLTLRELPEGIHSFFLLHGTGRIDISVSESRWQAIDFSAKAGSGGSL